MDIKIISPKIILPLIAALCFLTPAFAQAQDAIGRIIQSAGVVTAVNTAGAERRIARGSEIFVGETITTGPRGSTQLRLIDGAIISLEVDSFFSVDEFEYDGAGGAADSVIMTMARGTLRTLTGTIGDDPADTYEFNTPFASIGVRGTEYAVVIDNSGRVRVFVFDGSISVAPSAGGLPTIVGLEGNSDAVDLSDDTTVSELTGDDIPPAIQNLIESMDVAPMSDDQVSRLPDPDMAVEVQRNQEQNQQDAVLQGLREQAPGDDNAAGNLVDANGQVQVVRNENDVINARAVVVISIEERNPGSFDVTTVVGVSPNRP